MYVSGMVTQQPIFKNNKSTDCEKEYNFLLIDYKKVLYVIEHSADFKLFRE